MIPREVQVHTHLPDTGAPGPRAGVRKSETPCDPGSTTHWASPGTLTKACGHHKTAAATHSEPRASRSVLGLLYDVDTEASRGGGATWGDGRTDTESQGRWVLLPSPAPHSLPAPRPFPLQCPLPSTSPLLSLTASQNLLLSRQLQTTFFPTTTSFHPRKSSGTGEWGPNIGYEKDLSVLFQMRREGARGPVLSHPQPHKTRGALRLWSKVGSHGPEPPEAPPGSPNPFPHPVFHKPPERKFFSISNLNTSCCC